MLSFLENGWRLLLRRVHLVLGAEETAVSGTHWKYLSRAGQLGLRTRSQALRTRVREWKPSTFWTMFVMFGWFSL